MPELLAVPEPLLKVGFFVHFSKGWDKKFEDKLFQLEVVQQIPRYVHRIIESGATMDIKLEDEGYYPTSPRTLYEILFGFKGENIILYPMLPGTDYYLKLEESGFIPVPTDDNKRYLGGYTEEDMPYKQPMLREYVLKKDFMETIVYRLYNDSPEDEHFVLRGIVNRCKLGREVVGKEKEDILKRRPPLFREIPHWTVIKW